MRDDPLAGWFPDDADRAVEGPATDSEGREPAPAPASSSWLEGAGPDDDVDPPSRRRLVVLATVPWLVSAGLGWALVTGGDEPRRTDAADHAPPPTALSDAAPAVGAGGTPATGSVLAGQVGPDLAARAALWTRELVTGPVDEDTMRYVDLAVTEQVFLEGALAVAIVGAYVLEGSPQRWDGGRVDRFALALRPEDGSHVAGPWPIGPAGDTTHAVSWEAGDRAAEPVERALSSAGYADVELDEVATSTETPGVIRVLARGRGPGLRPLESHELLLRDSDPPELLGPAAPPTTQPDPPLEPAP